MASTKLVAPKELLSNAEKQLFFLAFLFFYCNTFYYFSFSKKKRPIEWMTTFRDIIEPISLQLVFFPHTSAYSYPASAGVLF